MKPHKIRAKIDVLDLLVDLHKQAISEHSHYYTAQVIRAAMREIMKLRETIRRIERRKKNGLKE